MDDNEIKERIRQIQEMRSNPCNENEHDYVDMMFASDYQAGTMLNVVCKKCFDVKGWIYR